MKRLTMSILLVAATTVVAQTQTPSATVQGYVIDSACTFVKNLKKPISSECALACAKAGSPLVILGDDGVIYWPISAEMPAAGQNERLIPFAGQRVRVSGRVYQKGGSRAIVIEKIEKAP